MAESGPSVLSIIPPPVEIFSELRSQAKSGLVTTQTGKLYDVVESGFGDSVGGTPPSQYNHQCLPGATEHLLDDSAIFCS